MFDFVYKLPLYAQVIIFLISLVIGIIFLVKFSDIFVDGASSVAKKLKISSMIIGLTVVAIGTSCPELAVSVSDSITALINQTNANVAIANVVGSNICNLLIVLGCSVIFTPIVVKKSVCKREFPFLLIVSALLVIFGIFFGTKENPYAILRFEGIIFVLLVPVYIAFLIINAKRDISNKEISLEEEEALEEEIKTLPLWKSILFIIFGAIGIAVGGEAVVFGAKGIALSISDGLKLNHDLAESLIGLTVVAVGTSLPELVTSVAAAKKGENDMALGNVIGSNIFNILFVLGISACVNPLTTGSQIVVDLIVMIISTVIVYIMALRKKLGKKEGIILLSLYFIYLVYLILRTVL